MLKRKRHSQLCEINVVPYIDVMLVLLIIFMVTAPLMFQGVNVNLPTSSAKPLESKPQEPIVVSVDINGNYYLNIADHPTQPIAEQDLINLIVPQLTHAPGIAQRQVLVKGDRSVNYGKVMQVMVLLQHAGAQSVGLITQPNQAIKESLQTDTTK